MAVPTKIVSRRSVVGQVTSALTGSKNAPQKTVFRLAKTDEPVIKILRRALNKDDYRMRVRFRGPRVNGSKNHTKKENARWFAIYIDKKE